MSKADEPPYAKGVHPSPHSGLDRQNLAEGENKRDAARERTKAARAVSRASAPTAPFSPLPRPSGGLK